MTTPALLSATLVSLLAGSRGTGDAEQLSPRLSRPMRRRLDIGRRVPDTTLRELLCRLDPDQARAMLWRGVRSADRRKALAPRGQRRANPRARRGGGLCGDRARGT